MGGAYVANGSGVASVNYNPAALREGGAMEILLPNVNLRVDDHIGLEDLVNDLNDPAVASSPTLAINVLNRLDAGGSFDGVGYAGAAVGVNLAIFSYAVGYSDLIEGSIALTNVDTTPAGVLDPSNNLLSYGALEGQQLVFTGAFDLGGITVGINARQIEATTYTFTQNVFTDPEVSFDALDQGVEADADDTAVDIGVLFDLGPMLRVGAVGRNINEPEFDLAGGGKLVLDSRYRAGAAFKVGGLKVSADMDLTEADMDLTEVESFGGTKYQEFAVGAELKLPVVALRAGLSQNTAESDDPALFHAGLGLNFPVLKIDVGGMIGESGDFYAAGANLTFGF
jgi:hypothetical protein